MNSIRFYICTALVIICLPLLVRAQVGGSGTTDFVPLWTSSTTLGNSAIFQIGGKVGMGTKVPGAKLDVVGAISTTGAVRGKNTSLSTTTVPIGVLGLTAAPLGVGVFGRATTTTGTGPNECSTACPFGVIGLLDGPFGAGVAGTASSRASNANAAGVAGRADTPFGPGVLGLSTSTVAGGGNGVSGISMNPTGAGVVGQAMTKTGFAAGVAAFASSPNAAAAFLQNRASGNIVVGAVGTTPTTVFRVDGTGKGFFDGGTQTGGADFAESFAVHGKPTEYQPGDLLVIDPSGERRVQLASQPYSTLVAGIYSTRPGVLASTHRMNDAAAKTEIPLAVVGVVPCKVTAENGKIAVGDLLVTSSIPGYAMKGTDRNRMLGAIVGKALQPLEKGVGVIQVLVTLQ